MEELLQININSIHVVLCTHTLYTHRRIVALLLTLLNLKLKYSNNKEERLYPLKRMYGEEI
jgi:CRISPR/Cas system-associated protein Cas7 (RAMP superfamily)